MAVQLLNSGILFAIKAVFQLVHQFGDGFALGFVFVALGNNLFRRINLTIE